MESLLCDSNLGDVSLYYYVTAKQITDSGPPASIEKPEKSVCLSLKQPPLSPPAYFPSRLIITSPFCPSTDNTFRQPAVSVHTHPSLHPHAVMAAQTFILNSPYFMACRPQVSVEGNLTLHNPGSEQSRDFEPRDEKSRSQPQEPSTDRASSEE